jgi:hypothetical protein
VVEITGVTYEVTPVEMAVPPDDAAYQSIVDPAGGTATIVTVPTLHRDTSFPVGVDGKALTVTVATEDVADEQTPLVTTAR